MKICERFSVMFVTKHYCAAEKGYEEIARLLRPEQ